MGAEQNLSERTELPSSTGRRRGGHSRMCAEKPKDFKGTMRKLIAFAAQYKVAIGVSALLAVVSVVFSVIGPKVLGNAVTLLYEGLVARVAGTGGIDFEGIGRVLLVLLGLYLASSACIFAQGWVMSGVTQRVCYRLRELISQKIAVVPMSYFEDHSKGDVLSRITNDVDTLGQSLNQSVTQLITSVVQILGVLVMMLTISPQLTGVVVLTLPLSLVIVGVVVSLSQKHFRTQQAALGEVNGIVEEDFAGQEVVTVFDRADDAVSQFEEANDRLFASAWKSQFLSGLMHPLMILVGNMGYVAVVVVGANLVIAGSIKPGDILAFIQYVRNFTQPVSQLAQVSNMLQSMAAAAERVFAFLDAPEETDDVDASQFKTPERRGAVEFDHVAFGYLPDETVVHDFSCEVSPGQTVAIVGPTGAGKTTLMKLMLRFYDVSAGAVRVEGVDVREWPRLALREDFAMVLQDTWLFAGTIRENIRYGRLDATDEEVETAARAARCDHFIKTLPEGYDFMVNEDGTNVSQGQRQLITIARAILADRPILILDEATSNVDTRTEEVIQRAMDTLMEGRTCFVIAHRLSTIRDADVILVLRDGDIVERGTHEQLLAAQGFYATLYNSQFDQLVG